jgi:hypothetical protein
MEETPCTIRPVGGPPPESAERVAFGPVCPARAMAVLVMGYPLGLASAILKPFDRINRIYRRKPAKRSNLVRPLREAAL